MESDNTNYVATGVAQKVWVMGKMMNNAHCIYST
jgi:hypothetical protein